MTWKVKKASAERDTPGLCNESCAYRGVVSTSKPCRAVAQLSWPWYQSKQGERVTVYIQLTRVSSYEVALAFISSETVRYGHCLPKDSSVMNTLFARRPERWLCKHTGQPAHSEDRTSGAHPQFGEARNPSRAEKEGEDETKGKRLLAPAAVHDIYTRPLGVSVSVCELWPCAGGGGMNMNSSNKRWHCGGLLLLPSFHVHTVRRTEKAQHSRHATRSRVQGRSVP